MGKVERQSNIELLRILTMCGVVVLHYNNENMGGTLLCNRDKFIYSLFSGKYFYLCGQSICID